MFLDWKSQYCENDYTTPSYIQIQCNPYKIINGIFPRKTKNFKICMEIQKTATNQSNLEKEQSWQNHVPRLQAVLQSFSNQTVQYWRKSRHKDQCNRTEINPLT